MGGRGGSRGQVASCWSVGNLYIAVGVARRLACRGGEVGDVHVILRGHAELSRCLVVCQPFTGPGQLTTQPDAPVHALLLHRRYLKVLLFVLNLRVEPVVRVVLVNPQQTSLCVVIGKRARGVLEGSGKVIALDLGERRTLSEQRIEHQGNELPGKSLLDEGHGSRVVRHVEEEGKGDMNVGVDTIVPEPSENNVVRSGGEVNSIEHPLARSRLCALHRDVGVVGPARLDDAHNGVGFTAILEHGAAESDANVVPRVHPPPSVARDMIVEATDEVIYGRGKFFKVPPRKQNTMSANERGVDFEQTSRELVEMRLEQGHDGFSCRQERNGDAERLCVVEELLQGIGPCENGKVVVKPASSRCLLASLGVPMPAHTCPDFAVLKVVVFDSHSVSSTQVSKVITFSEVGRE